MLPFRSERGNRTQCSHAGIQSGRVFRNETLEQECPYYEHGVHRSRSLEAIRFCMEPANTPFDLQGTILKRRELPSLRLTENMYPVGFGTARHFHEHALIGCVVTGSYTNVYGVGKHHIHSRAVMYCPPGEMHKTSSLCGAHCLNLELGTHYTDQMREIFIPQQPLRFDNPAIATLGAKLYCEFNASDLASSLAIEAVTLEMMACAARCRESGPSSKAPNWLVRAREIVHDRFAEPLRITALADEIGVHPVYLSTSFRKAYGLLIGDYVRQLRIRWACERLLNSADALATVAQLAGFADQSHFCRVFKRIIGITPAAYRSATRMQSESSVLKVLLNRPKP